jgi:hypothetical protein
MKAWLLLAPFVLLAACGSDDDNDNNSEDCRGNCPTTAASDDAEAACAELGAGQAYCFKQNGTLDTAVNCPAGGGSSLVACLGGKACTLNPDNSEANCD